VQNIKHLRGEWLKLRNYEGGMEEEATFHNIVKI